MKTNTIRKAAKNSASALICAGSILACAAYAQVDLNTHIDFNMGTGIYTYSHGVLNQGPTFDLAIVNLNVATNSNLMNLSAPTGFNINFDPGVGIVSFFEDADPATPQTFAPNSTTTPFVYTSTFAPVPIGFDALDAGGNTFTGFTLSAAPDSSVVNNAVVTGIISGNFTLTKTTAGMLTLTNTNTYTGGTTLNAGTLSFANGSLGSVGTVDFAGNATLQYFGTNTQDISSRVKVEDGVTATFDTNGNNVTFASALQVGAAKTGAVTKIGAGALILTGANTYIGGTTLNAGVLAAGNASAFGRGNLTVNGGTLQTVGGPLIVNIGAGHILFNGGTYVANVGGVTPGVQHDQLTTTGSANINGGTLALVQQNNYRLAPGDKVVLVSAAGGVAGGTTNGTALPATNVSGLSAFNSSPLLVAVVNLFPTTVVLELMQGSFAAQGGTLGFTANQFAVARALDSVASRIGSRTGVFNELNFLDTQPLGTLAHNLDRISPEELTSIFHIAKSLANIQTANIQRRLEDIRSDSEGGGATVQSVTQYRGGASGPTGRVSKEIVSPKEDRWGVFFTGSGEFTRVGSTSNAAGFSLDSGGVTAGVDYRFTDKFAAGISLGYANTTADLSNGGKVDVDGGRVGAYATYYDRGLHLDAAVSGGLNSYKTRRATPNNTSATASPDGSEVNVLFGAGYDWKFNGLTIGPVASFQYTNVQLDGFTETGGFAPLSVIKRNEESMRTAIGMHATFDVKMGRAILRPEVRAAWQHEFGDTSYSLTSTFATLGGSAFKVAGPETGRDSLLVGAGLSLLLNNRFSVYAFYDGELLRQNYSSHNISAGFRLKF